MFEISSQTWFPVVTLILGILLKGMLDALSDGRAAERERDARLDHRYTALALKRIEFQHATLLALQECIQRLGRFSGQSHHQDVMAFRSSGTWQKRPLTKEVNEGMRAAFADLIQLRVRVSDDEIRDLAVEFTKACARSGFAADEAEGEKLLLQVMELHERLHEQIGVTVRKLDDREGRLSSPSH